MRPKKDRCDSTFAVISVGRTWDWSRGLEKKGLELRFEDAGFTGVEPLNLYIREIDSRPEKMYGWVQTEQFNLRRGADFGRKHPWAKSLLVLIRNYHRRAFPRN